VITFSLILQTIVPALVSVGADSVQWIRRMIPFLIFVYQSHRNTALKWDRKIKRPLNNHGFKFYKYTYIEAECQSVNVKIF